MTMFWKLDRDAAATRVILAGYINERADFSALAAAIPPGPVVFDLAEVQRINSPGILQWIRFFEQLVARGDAIALERCSVVIVHQLAMVRRFSGGAVVRSALAPFACIKCEREQPKLIQVDGDIAAQIESAGPCSSCGRPLTLDDLPDNYLRLRHA